MEQAESNPDSLRIFTTERWFVQLDMAARGIACCSKLGTSGRITMQVAEFKLPACSRVTGNPEVDRHEGSRWIISGLPTIHARSAHVGLVAVTTKSLFWNFNYGNRKTTEPRPLRSRLRLGWSYTEQPWGASEVVFQRELNLPGALGRLNETESGPDAAIWRRENRCVGKIDEFGAELQVLMFRDGDEFRNTQVSVMQGRPAKCANATSTESSCGCGRDRGWIKPRKAATQSCTRVRSRRLLGGSDTVGAGKTRHHTRIVRSLSSNREAAV